MVKEVNVILMGILMTLFLTISNGTYLFYQVEDPVGFVSGNSIRETITGFYEVSSVNHRVFILFQFLLLFVIVISFFVIIRKFKSKAKLSKCDFLKKGGAKSGTDLDILYEILKRKKEINIDDIGKVFKVNLDIALGWSKILEDGNLAMIDYPRFGKPVLRLSEEENGEETVAKNTIGNAKKIQCEKAKEKNNDVRHDNVTPIKKVVAQKNISKKEMKKNKKVMKKKVGKIKGKKVGRKSKKR